MLLSDDRTKVSLAQEGKPDRMAGESDIFENQAGKPDIRVGKSDIRYLQRNKSVGDLPKRSRKI